MSGTRKVRRNRSWKTMSPRQRALTLTLASIQLSLALTAWIDLARRPASQVRGQKRKWAATIGINFVGPVLYFVRGIKR